nr:choice-of-anchor I family protein [uncultured Flavobacterium sp.]
MIKNYTKNFLLLGGLLVANTMGAQTLLHYWNFNNNSSEAALTTVSQSIVGAPAITGIISGSSVIDFAGGTGQNFDVENLNAQNGDAAGTHLRFNTPIGSALIFSLPTTGYENPMVQFATRRSGSGAGTQTWSYSTDGTNYTVFSTVEPNNGNPELATLDFSAIASADNNPNFKLKVEFSLGSGGDGGNNRFDNFTLKATPIEGTADTTAPVVTVTPADAATNVAVNTPITIAFNEAVRLADNTAINNTNVDAVVSLHSGNANGPAVAFDATFANNTITITPSVALTNGQQYYVALLPNTIEDLSDNAVADSVTSLFSTIAVQTELTAGDMAFVGYRMNASSTEDQIALVTFVDIAAGTMINFTDAKYTTNAQPQCAGGFTWTANSCLPAGSVITIQTDTLITNTGTTGGSGFGLSSGGDQVIVYTGTAANPNYITALSSKGWVAQNTSCGGSDSMLPAGLTDLITASNLSTAPGSDSGNTVNAYYSGVQTGTVAELKATILNPANWTGVAAGTAPQQWPAWAFPSSPTVQSVAVISGTSIRLTFNNELDATAVATLSNYSGISDLVSAVATGNVVVLTYANAFVSGTSYELTVNNIEDEAGLTMACPYTYAFSFNTTISFDETYIVTNEEDGSLNLVLNIESPAAGTVDLVVKPAPFSTADSNDFTLATQTLTIPATGNTITVNIPIIDDEVAEQHSEYFVVSLENPQGLSISGDTFATIYIKDNDSQAPQPSHAIELDYLGSFDPSGVNHSTCEIVVYDPVSQKLFTTSAVEGRLDVINFANPEAPVTISSIDMTPYGGVTSVAVKNGVVAVASPAEPEDQNGSVVFFDTNGTFLKQVTVGALPDNISFTPDGTKVLTANEGQPNADYSIDPEGSVSIIDITGGVANLTNANVNTIYFTAYNTPEAEATLMVSGVRKLKATSTMSQDFEPEYITTSADSQKAWVALQENNAIAEINLASGTINSIWGLGTKDMSLPGNGFDISDNNGEVLIANWPIQTYFIPDGIGSYSVNGTNYIVTANEGDEKEYGSFVERTTIGASSYTLDAAVYPQAEMLKKSFNAGRFRVTNLNGNTDADTDFEQIYAVGSRSFSIFNADSKQIVFDSGDDFERYTAAEPSISTLFNSDSEDNSFKSRSRAKGPEPEGITLAHISDRVFAFVGLERVGGVMVYDVTDPSNAQFVDYKNSRMVSAYGGDNGPEGITYIDAANSPTGIPYIIVANEISGTLSIYSVNTENLSTGEVVKQPKAFTLFPNPAANGIVYFNRVADVEVFDYTGKLIHSAKQAYTIDTKSFATGIYLVKTSEGIVKKLIIK